MKAPVRKKRKSVASKTSTKKKKASRSTGGIDTYGAISRANKKVKARKKN